MKMKFVSQVCSLIFVCSICLSPGFGATESPGPAGEAATFPQQAIIQVKTSPAAPTHNNDGKDSAQLTSPYPVFFVSNRRSKEKHGELSFGSRRSSELSFGEISAGQESSGKGARRMRLFHGEQEFLAAVKSTGSRKVAFFVHGYRKSFDSSIDFGMKMSRNLNAPLVVFAWPSKNNYCAYMADECTAEWSSHMLSGVLGDLGDSAGFRNVVIICHSLGARMVQWALRDLYAERKPPEPFAAALFFSPDVDRDSFLQDSSFLKHACAECRVYLDTHDTRIRISKFLHGSPRVGSGNNDSAEAELSKRFNCDTSLSSHEIPFELVSNSVQHLSEEDPQNDN